jgi:hypothetical protein
MGLWRPADGDGEEAVEIEDEEVAPDLARATSGEEEDAAVGRKTRLRSGAAAPWTRHLGGGELEDTTGGEQEVYLIMGRPTR